MEAPARRIKPWMVAPADPAQAADPFDDRVNENGGLQPGEQLMNDMGKLIEEMTAAGVPLDTAGLRPTS